MSFVGDILGSMGAEDAEDAQYKATQEANKLQRYMYDTTRQDNMPALDARNWSLERLQGLLGGEYGKEISVGDVTAEPGYQFGMQQGQQALQRQLNARGMNNSGAALKAASRYGTDYGSTKYNEAFNRELTNRNSVMNPLLSLAGAGQLGANTIASSGQNYANAAGQNMTNMGNATAASLMNQYQGWGNALMGNSAVGSFGKLIGFGG